MARLLLWASVVTLAGCQCFVPVFEAVDDSGQRVDGGSADAGPECRTQADCPSVNAPRGCAFSTTSPSRSCVDGRCVFDCVGARTCTSAQGTCLACDGGVPACPGDLCSWVTHGEQVRFARACDGDAGWAPLGTFTVRSQQGATCHFDVVSADGGRFGTLALLGDFATATATFVDEPGVTCTVNPLATALNRVEVGCARCVGLYEWP